jgi:hypothetical protein
MSLETHQHHLEIIRNPDDLPSGSLAAPDRGVPPFASIPRNVTPPCVSP